MAYCIANVLEIIVGETGAGWYTGQDGFFFQTAFAQ